MKKIILLSAGLLIGLSAKVRAQQVPGGQTAMGVTVEARFPGDSLYSFLSNNLHYPAALREAGVEGRVFVQMVIGPDGTITKPETLRSSGHPELDQEALRIIRLMPRWIPAKKDGKNVASIYRIPVTFNLN